MPVFNFTDNDGIDVGNKYVTKDYLIDYYPELIPAAASPDLWTWGSGDYGQLGDNSITGKSSPSTTINSSQTWTILPTNVTFSGTGAIKSDGTLWTWGYNAYGQLGNSGVISRSSPGTTSGGGTNWAQVSFGFHHTAAVKTDGTLWTWGNNQFGQLGTGNTTSRSSPGTTAGTSSTLWRQVSCGYSITGAVKIDGTLWTWGSNGRGELGTGNTTSRTSPGTTAGGGTNWKQILVSTMYQVTTRSNMIAAIKTDGTLWTWGSNIYGALGTGDTTSRSSPGNVAGGGTNWKQVYPMNGTTAAIKTDGTLWTWGNNDYGQLGDGSKTSRTSPGTTVGGGTDWKYVACGYWYGLGTTYIHTAAIKTDGTLWTWGLNNGGQLGISTPSSRSSPGTTAGGGTNWKQVVCGNSCTFGIREAGNW